jgi:hypothetical protein
MNSFKLDEIGELTEYLGYTGEYERENEKILVRQPVFMPSFMDEFDLRDEEYPVTPTIRYNVLVESADIWINITCI